MPLPGSLQGKTFSPISATPTDEAARGRLAQALLTGQRSIMLPTPPSFGGVLPSPSPLLAGRGGWAPGMGGAPVAGLAGGVGGDISNFGLPPTPGPGGPGGVLEPPPTIQPGQEPGTGLGGPPALPPGGGMAPPPPVSRPTPPTISAGGGPPGGMTPPGSPPVPSLPSVPTGPVGPSLPSYGGGGGGDSRGGFGSGAGSSGGGTMQGDFGTDIRGTGGGVTVEIGQGGSSDGAQATGPGSRPALEFGGIVTRPLQALIGERGPEAVIPLNRLAQMLEANRRGNQTSPQTPDRSMNESITANLPYNEARNSREDIGTRLAGGGGGQLPPQMDPRIIQALAARIARIPPEQQPQQPPIEFPFNDYLAGLNRPRTA